MASASAGPRNWGLRIRPVAAEATDGAVDEPWIQFAKTFRTRAQTLRDTGPEVLDEDVRLADEALEQPPVGIALEIEYDPALVAVVGLEVRRVPAALIAAVRV